MSGNRWLHNSTVLPSSRSRKIRSFISRVPIGSSPVVGSSSTISSGIVDQRLGQTDAPRHALGIFLELPAPGPIQLDVGNQPIDTLPPFRRRHIEQAAVEVQRFLGVQELVQVRLLGQVADPFVLADVGGVLAEHQRPAAGGKQQPQEQLDGRRLARAVGAQQAENLAPPHFQVERFEGPHLLPAPEVAVDLGQIVRLDHDFGLRMRPRVGSLFNSKHHYSWVVSVGKKESRSRTAAADRSVSPVILRTAFGRPTQVVYSVRSPRTDSSGDLPTGTRSPDALPAIVLPGQVS